MHTVALRAMRRAAGCNRTLVQDVLQAGVVER